MNRRNLYLLGNYSIQEAFDILATNYKNKLPLIFGQWDTLKDILQKLSVYNFDVIIDYQARSRFLETPVVLKGNKEYYDTNRNIAIYNRDQMRNLYNVGIMALERFHLNSGDKENNNRYWENPKTIAIYRKLMEIGVLLGYHSNPGTPGRPSTDNKYSLSYVYDIDVIPTTWVLERAFAHEITFLYYLNLNSDIYVPRLFPQNDNDIMANAPQPSEKTKEVFWSQASGQIFGILIEIAKGKTCSNSKEEAASEGVVFQLY